MTTNAVEGAPIADDGTVFPVLIMLVGIKGSYRQIQTFQVEELVSHGYVVAAIDQPYSVAMVVYPDGHRWPTTIDGHRRAARSWTRTSPTSPAT